MHPQELRQASGQGQPPRFERLAMLDPNRHQQTHLPEEWVVKTGRSHPSAAAADLGAKIPQTRYSFVALRSALSAGLGSPQYPK